MADDEKKPPTIREMLEQALRNQQVILGVISEGGCSKVECVMCIRETNVLLDRID